MFDNTALHQFMFDNTVMYQLGDIMLCSEHVDMSVQLLNLAGTLQMIERYI